jgi:PAS domain-containing protein
MPETTAKERSQATRETVTVAVASLMALFAGVVAVWIMAVGSMRESYRQSVLQTAQQLALRVSHAEPRDQQQLLGELKAEAGDLRYLQLIVAEEGLTRVHVDTRSLQERVAAGTRLLDDEAMREIAESGEVQARESALQRGIAFVGTQPVPGPDGYWLSAWIPVTWQDGKSAAALRVVANADVLMARLAEARKTAMLGLVPSCLMLLVMALGIHRIRLDRIRLNRHLRVEQGRSRESEQSFRSLFELSPLGISLYDSGTGKFLQVNDALVEATGHSREELLQLSHDDVAPDARDAARRGRPKSWHRPISTDRMKATCGAVTAVPLRR